MIRKASHSKSAKRIVVVGGGMAAHRFCQRAMERGLHRRFAITLIGEEPRVPYDRVHLTRYFGTRDFEDIQLAPTKWYASLGIKLLIGKRVAEIDRTKNLVTTEDRIELPFDHLVLACGSTAFVPPIDGTDSPGVFVYRSVDDVAAIRQHAKISRRCLILGGGLLGLEAAQALLELGLETHVVEYANGLMSRQLNQDGSAVLEQQLRALGLRVHLGRGATKIERQRGSLEVAFTTGSSLAVDLVVIAAGIRPRDDLARSSGLEIGARGGIVIDDQLRTSDPSIYAIGECAQHRGSIYGFVAPANQMADILADRLAGIDGAFQGADLSCRLKLVGVEVSAFGDYLGVGKTLAYRTPTGYRMIVLQRDRIVGGTVVGNWIQTHQLQLAVRERRILTPSQQERFERSGDLDEPDTLSDWPDSALVCTCMQVSKGKISSCIADGCRSVEAISQRTRAGTVCGSCRPVIAQLVGSKDSEPIIPLKGLKALCFAGALSAIIALGFVLIGPIPTPQSVQTFSYRLSQLWHDELAKQISGFTMAGLSGLAILLSARKRIGWLRHGNYGLWRAAHGLIGLGCLVALVAHTGLNFGENLNRWLMVCFIGLNTVGAMAGLSIAIEKKLDGPWSRRIRTLITRCHILFFWPYPALLGFHIYKVYAF